MALTWTSVGSLKGAPGDTGPAGSDGTSITGATVNGSGDLIVTLSTGGEINAGHVVGAAGTSVDFAGSVNTTGDLPATATPGEARYVRDVGHLFVYETADMRPEAVDGWTDVGQIKGDPGDTGPAGADGSDGVSVTGAAIDGAGHLIVTLSTGGPIDAGVARGSDGAPGSDGAQGPRGAQIEAYTGATPPAVPGHIVGDLALNGNTGELFRLIDDGS
jgi:hypothetical protein